MEACRENINPKMKNKGTFEIKRTKEQLRLVEGGRAGGGEGGGGDIRRTRRGEVKEGEIK